MSKTFMEVSEAEHELACQMDYSASLLINKQLALSCLDYIGK